MSTRTRREFLSEAALTAAAVGLGPGLTAALSLSAQSSNRPYLDIAVRCANWIDRSAQEHDGGTVAWPADPLRPAAVGLDLYNGTPGVVMFLANLYQATGDEKWRTRAERGGKYLTAFARTADRIGAGLYTGIAGLGSTYQVLAATNVSPAFGDAARKAASDLVARAKTVGDGVEWNDVNDIIGGGAGTGLWLIDAARFLSDRALGDLAAKAGRRLIAKGVPAEGGLMWFPAGMKGANYPNFAHGTAGVAYFLATLHQQTREQAFLDAALAGAKYLEAVSTQRGNARAIFHVSGGGENRFYLSWCHGPVGTARLFYRLHQITGDRQWYRWIDELNAWLLASGAPEQQSDGYWNNISQCCGNVGIGQYLIDLARKNLWRPATLSSRVVTNTLGRATDHASGLRWIQAENRVSPDNKVAQTGFMQGAAGVGTFFLQLDAFSRNQPWRTPMADTPW